MELKLKAGSSPVELGLRMAERKCSRCKARIPLVQCMGMELELKLLLLVSHLWER